MTQMLMESATLEAPSRPPSSRLLEAALAAPSGWQRGLSVPWYSCGEPIVRDKCVSAVDEPHRVAVADYAPFPIEQGSTCSTLSKLPHEDFARARLDNTTEWALGRQLQSDPAATGSPKLEDATSLGVVADADFVTALGCLEQAAADAGFGSQWWLHAPMRAASYLGRYRLLVDGHSPSGAPWVLSPGYTPTDATTVTLWASGPVWAAVDEPDTHAAVDWRVNDDTAWALRAGIVAMDPCLLLSIDITVPACPTVP